MALAAAEAPATDHQAAHGSVAEVMLKSDNTSACGAQRAFMSSAANAAASTMCNSYQVPRQPPQGRFIASELHRPEAPNMPSWGGVTPGSGRSYSDAVRWHPPGTRANAQPCNTHRRPTKSLETGRPGPAASYKISFTGRSWARITSLLTVEIHSVAWLVTGTDTLLVTVLRRSKAPTAPSPFSASLPQVHRPLPPRLPSAFRPVHSQPLGVPAPATPGGGGAGAY